MKWFILALMETGFFVALFLMFWLIKKLKQATIYLIEKARIDKKLRNDIYSCIYFLRDMGPNVSAYSVVAIFITTQDSINQLFGVFLAGIAIKRIGRRLANKFAIMIGEEKC